MFSLQSTGRILAVPRKTTERDTVIRQSIIYIYYYGTAYFHWPLKMENLHHAGLYIYDAAMRIDIDNCRDWMKNDPKRQLYVCNKRYIYIRSYDLLTRTMYKLLLYQFQLLSTCVHLCLNHTTDGRTEWIKCRIRCLQFIFYH